MELYKQSESATSWEVGGRRVCICLVMQYVQARGGAADTIERRRCANASMHGPYNNNTSPDAVERAMDRGWRIDVVSYCR